MPLTGVRQNSTEVLGQLLGRNERGDDNVIMPFKVFFQGFSSIEHFMRIEWPPHPNMHAELHSLMVSIVDLDWCRTQGIENICCFVASLGIAYIHINKL